MNPSNATPENNATSLADVSTAWPSLEDTLRVLTLRAGFNTNTVVAGATLLGLAAGVVGVFALLRKRSLVTDALSHATLPGIALAFLAATALGYTGRSLPVLLTGAAVTGVAAIACIQLILKHTRLREDAAIGIVLSVSFGAGVVGLSYIQSNAAANAAGLSKFIYGQTAAMSVADATFMGVIAAAAIAAALLLHKEFALVCFNDAFAKVGGWPVAAIDLAMMALVVLVTVAGLQAVGLILVVALLIIPAVAARFWTERLSRLLVLAGALGALSGYLGATASALLPRQPAGAVIVLTAGTIFTISMLLAPRRGVIANTARHARLRLRIAGEHLLEAAHDHARDHPHTPHLDRATRHSIARQRGWHPAALAAITALLVARKRLATTRRGLTLTPRGAADGARVRRNHDLWTAYLIKHADVAPNHVDWSVDQVEHVLSTELIAQLEDELQTQPQTETRART